MLRWAGWRCPVTRSVLVGFLLTGLAVVVFMLWTFWEMRRVDRVIEEVATREADEEGEGGEDEAE